MKLYNKKYKYVLCDSIKAYNFYKKKIKYIHLLTASPALIKNNDIRAISIYKFWTTKKLRKFQESIFSHNQKVFSLLKKNKNINRYENLVTNLAINRFQKVIFKIACISNIKLNDKCLFIKHISNKVAYKYANNNWNSIIKDNKVFDTIEFHENKNSLNDDSESFTEINFFRRLFFAGFQIIKMRIFAKIHHLLRGFNIKRKYVIFFNENELLLEACSTYINKGYQILNLSDVKKLNSDIDLTNINLIYKLCEPFIKKRLKLWTHKNYQKAALNLFKKDLENNLKDFYKWELTFKLVTDSKKYLNSSNTLLFCNAPANEKCLAIKKVMNNLNIPLIAFQHGVSAEISGSHSYNRIWHDSSASDIFVSFNKNSSLISSTNPFSKSRAITFRGSMRFKRLNSLIFNRVKKNSLLYLSNNLYKGNFGSLGTWTTDEDMATNEIKLINNVLCKINKTVFYKPYPEINFRYYDLDPALAIVKEKHNMKLIKNKLDARYIVSDYEIIMCGSATSTLSWAIMSNKPLVFINYKNHAPLKKEAYYLLKKGVFLFDFDNKDFKNHIIDFMELNLNDIKEIWKSKKMDREKFINDYISTNNYKDDLFSLLNEKLSKYNYKKNKA